MCPKLKSLYSYSMIAWYWPKMWGAGMLKNTPQQHSQSRCSGKPGWSDVISEYHHVDCMRCSTKVSDNHPCDEEHWKRWKNPGQDESRSTYDAAETGRICDAWSRLDLQTSLPRGGLPNPQSQWRTISELHRLHWCRCLGKILAGNGRNPKRPQTLVESSWWNRMQRTRKVDDRTTRNPADYVVECLLISNYLLNVRTIVSLCFSAFAVPACTLKFFVFLTIRVSSISFSNPTTFSLGYDPGEVPLTCTCLSSRLSSHETPRPRIFQIFHLHRCRLFELSTSSDVETAWPH